MLCFDLLISFDSLISASINDRRLHFSFRHETHSSKERWKLVSEFDRWKKKQSADRWCISSSRPTYEKKWNNFSDTSSTGSSRKKRERMMMNLIAGSFDILVRRVHKKREATEDGEHKDSKIPFSCEVLLWKNARIIIFSKSFNTASSQCAVCTLSTHDYRNYRCTFYGPKRAKSSFSCIFYDHFSPLRSMNTKLLVVSAMTCASLMIRWIFRVSFPVSITKNCHQFHDS